MSKRIDYDHVASEYDEQPYRKKEVDPHLIAFSQLRSGEALRALDLGCGTGNQLVANHPAFPDYSLVGLDESLGMLEVARDKSVEIDWIQGTLSALPFENNSFDYITCQYAFHHVADRVGALREVSRVTALKGRFVMQNISPRNMSGSLLYQYFPSAYFQDIVDFMAPEDITTILKGLGFIGCELRINKIGLSTTLEDFLLSVQDKNSNSELALLDHHDYSAGLRDVERSMSEHGPHALLKSEIALMTIIADMCE